MKLFLKQEHAVYYLKDKETTEILYGGGAGGGKSALGCLWLIEMCQTYPGSRWLIGRSKLKILTQTTLNTFFQQCRKLNITDQFTYREKAGEIVHTNGSVIILKDLFLYPTDPEFDSLGSLEICGAFIDEVGQISFKAWQIVKSRCRYMLNEFGLIPKVLGTCNPSKNWTYQKFYLAKKNDALADGRMFIQSLPTDNPHLPESYLQTLLSLDENSKQRLYYGNWEFDDDPATLITYDAINDYFQASHITRGIVKYMTIDVARKGKDKTVFRVWAGWLCIERHEIGKSGIDEVVRKAKEIQIKHNIPASRIVADEDGVGGGVVDYLKCKGFINNSRAFNGENFDNLKSQCSIYMSQKITNREVGELCENQNVLEITRQEMEQVKLKGIDKDGKQSVIPKDEVKSNIGRSPDEWDSIMMRYYFELDKGKNIRVTVG